LTERIHLEKARASLHEFSKADFRRGGGFARIRDSTPEHKCANYAFVIANRQISTTLCALASALALLPLEMPAQSADHPSGTGQVTNSESIQLPLEVNPAHFAALKEHSPFLRNLGLSQSLIITGVARIDGDPVATLFDLETSKTSVVSMDAVSPEGWQLVEVVGDLADVETLAARIRMAGGTEVVSIRYEKTPLHVRGSAGATVSSRVGNGTPGGGTGPHGGADPRVLTPDQMTDASNAARNIRDGFKADGYGDNETIPPEVVSKISRLSVEQRESINVKMYEYRNRGLGMPERQQIYNRMLDQTLERR